MGMLPISIDSDGEFSADRHAFAFVHSIGTIFRPVANGRHWDHLLASILSRNREWL